MGSWRGLAPRLVVCLHALAGARLVPPCSSTPQGPGAAVAGCIAQSQLQYSATAAAEIGLGVAGRDGGQGAGREAAPAATSSITWRWGYPSSRCRERPAGPRRLCALMLLRCALCCCCASARRPTSADSGAISWLATTKPSATSTASGAPAGEECEESSTAANFLQRGGRGGRVRTHAHAISERAFCARAAFATALMGLS